MNLTSEHRMREHAAINSSNVISESDVSEQGTNHDDKKLEGSRRAMLVGWLNSVCPESNLPKYASDEELRTCLFDGNIFVNILNRLKPVYINEVGEFTFSRASRLEKLTWFLAIIDKMGVPGFLISDLDKGSMKSVMDCLFALREQVPQTYVEDNTSIVSPRSVAGSPHSRSPVFSQFSPFSSEQRRKLASDSTFQHTLHSPTASGHKFHEVFQRKQGRYLDLPAAKISEMMTSNSLDHLLMQNAPTQSLLSVVNGILDESVERKTSEIPHRVTCLLRKVVQEIERRISTQAEHLRTQNNLFKSREEKYQSRIRVLEALAAGSGEEIPAEKIKVEDKKKIKEEEKKLIKEEEEKKIKEEEEKIKDEDMVKLLKEKEEKEQEILALKQELEAAKKINELQCMQMEAETKEAKENLGKRLKDLECLLADSRKKVQNLEAFSESKSRKWSTKEQAYQSFMDFQSKALQELRFFSDSIKQEIVKARLSYSEEFNGLGEKLKALLEMAEKYNVLLAENRKMLNEIQELKGNIRVYCRIRPFLASQRETRTTIEYVGESGELVIANPSKQGKEGHRLFKFNKVFGPVSSQAEIFSDIQPLIQSVLDGYNVCIFAYGQTGSGKTYTMMGPNASSKENWGVNYRALNDLFNLSQSRRSTTMFEIGVQIVEIYNEQVRDLLSSDSSHKRLGIMTQSQPYGLAVPDANMVPVKSTSDVIELMDIGLKNRAIGATALNERSSRSHSVVTVHVRGTDMKTATSLHGNLHLVDLAGSERVDRSEVTGDRLREAQHINKSLSALGDVIFSLAQKSSHVPYRNSKLTQLLQSSLGGQAKTLMFVQLNPDVNSYSESLSTLKFAERVSGVELGAARSSKEGRDVRELMDQVASLKDTILRKDDEIERLQLLKDLKNVYPDVVAESRGTNRNRPSFPNQDINGGPQRSQKHPSSKGLGQNEKTLSDHDTWSEYSDINSEVDSLQSMDDFRQQNKFFHQPEVAGGDSGQNVNDNEMRFVDPDYGERLADISDHSPFSRVETTVTAENSIFAEGTKSSENLDKPKSSISPRLMQKSGVAKDPLKVSSSTKKPATGLKPSRRWQ